MQNDEITSRMESLVASLWARYSAERVKTGLAVMSEPQYIVMNENVLGMVYAEWPDTVVVLRSSILRGGPALYPFGIGSLYKDRIIRRATLADFVTFRVMSPPGFASL